MIGCLLASGQLPPIEWMAAASILLALAVGAAETGLGRLNTALVLAAGTVLGLGSARLLEFLVERMAA